MVAKALRDSKAGTFIFNYQGTVAETEAFTTAQVRIPDFHRRVNSRTGTKSNCAHLIRGLNCVESTVH